MISYVFWGRFLGLSAPEGIPPKNQKTKILTIPTIFQNVVLHIFEPHCPGGLPPHKSVKKAQSSSMIYLVF